MLNPKQVIHLWGDPSQVAAAKSLILKFIGQCSNFAQSNKKIEWTKINAHSGRKDATDDYKEKFDIMLQQLRKEPDSPSVFPEKVYLGRGQLYL